MITWKCRGHTHSPVFQLPPWVTGQRRWRRASKGMQRPCPPLALMCIPPPTAATLRLWRLNLVGTYCQKWETGILFLVIWFYFAFPYFSAVCLNSASQQMLADNHPFHSKESYKGKWRCTQKGAIFAALNVGELLRFSNVAETRNLSGEELHNL